MLDHFLGERKGSDLCLNRFRIEDKSFHSSSDHGRIEFVGESTDLRPTNSDERMGVK